MLIHLKGGIHMNTYEINEDTLALIPKDDKTLVHETGGHFLVEESVNDILNESCEYFGSTLEGRQRGTTALTGITHKVPIIIEESREIIFFPTSSPRLEQKCGWISYNNIKKITRGKKGAVIEFKKGVKIASDLSVGVLNNQYLRASRLKLVLKERKAESETKFPEKSVKNTTKKVKK